MKVLQENDILGLKKKQSSDKKNKFILGTLLTHALYAIVALGITVTVGIGAFRLAVFEARFPMATVFGCVAFASLLIQIVIAARRAEFVFILRKIAFNLFFSATAVIWIFAGEGYLIFAVLHVVFSVLAWLFTALGYLIRKKFNFERNGKKS